MPGPVERVWREPGFQRLRWFRVCGVPNFQEPALRLFFFGGGGRCAWGLGWWCPGGCCGGVFGQRGESTGEQVADGGEIFQQAELDHGHFDDGASEGAAKHL